jgi:uncharacterized protein (DUF924 family)
MTPTTTTPKDVVAFWFSDEVRPKWYAKDEAFDALCRERFGAAVEAAMAGALDGWTSTAEGGLDGWTSTVEGGPDGWTFTAEGGLALVILLDQIPRNIHRGTPAAFSGDGKALTIAKAAIAAGLDAATPPDRRNFFYLPFMHSEALADQDRGMALYAANDVADGLKYMTAHRDIIVRFGRFPHRNAILGRASTPEELDFLQQPGSSF